METFRICLLPTLLTLLLFAGCQDKDQIARLRITLVDDAGDYEKVNINIQGIAVHTNEHASVDDNGWIVFENSDVGVKDVLELTDGAELTLVDTDFPAGRISQVRLILGEKDNTLKMVGQEEEILLETPSLEQSGLKLLVHEMLKGGISYEFKLDFDAARSIVLTNEGKYILSPVMHVTTNVLSGAIKGNVLPAEEEIAIILLQNGEEKLSTYAKAGGTEFLFPDVPEGQYSIQLVPGNESGLIKTTIDNVNVVLGEVTDIGEIELQ
jgi:hypothetical protein